MSPGLVRSKNGRDRLFSVAETTVSTQPIGSSNQMNMHLVGSHNSDLTTSVSQLLPRRYIYRVDAIQLIRLTV